MEGDKPRAVYPTKYVLGVLAQDAEDKDQFCVMCGGDDAGKIPAATLSRPGKCLTLLLSQPKIYLIVMKLLRCQVVRSYHSKRLPHSWQRAGAMRLWALSG